MSEFELAMLLVVLGTAILTFAAAIRGLSWGLTLLVSSVCFFLGTAVLAGAGVNPLLAWLILVLIGLAFVLTRKNQAQLLASGQVLPGFKKCHACAEVIREEAKKCRYCGSEQ